VQLAATWLINPRCFGLQRFPVGIKQVIFRLVAQMIIDKQLGISF